MATSIVNNRLSHYHPAQSAPLLVKPACRSGREGIKKLVPLLSKEGVGGGLIIIATFFLFLNPAHAGLILQHPTYTGLNQGLVGYWSFDGKDMAGVTAYDRSGQGNNGTLTNGPTRTAGKIGQGLSFDGSNDYVTAIDKGGLDNISQVSISLWIKLNHLASARGLHNAMITKLHSADPWISYEIFQYSVNDHILMEVINSSGTIKYADGPASIILGINTWYHVVGTYNGSNMMVYVNGTSGTPVAQTGTVYDSDSALKIGSDWTTYDDGLIDDVRIYNRALSSDEIKRLYNLGR